MSKTKTPFFSMGSQGSIGKVITSQKHGAKTLLRSKPIPPPSLTLPQQYQRWDYQDYAYFWTVQSEATKRQYASDGVRHHLTGFQYWMKHQLKDLPYLAGRWHLDEISGAVAHDTSKNSNHGTIFGASLTPGIIDYARYFDGIDDYINCGNDPTLRPEAITIECFIRTPNPLKVGAVGDNNQCLSRYDYGNNRRVFHLGLTNPGPGSGPLDTLFIALGDPADGTYEFAARYATPLLPGAKYHLALTFDAGTLLFYVNGQQVSLTTYFGAVPSALYYCDVPFLISGRLQNGSLRQPWFGDIDEVSLLNIALPPVLVERHSQRHYP